MREEQENTVEASAGLREHSLDGGQRGDEGAERALPGRANFAEESRVKDVSDRGNRDSTVCALRRQDSDDASPVDPSRGQTDKVPEVEVVARSRTDPAAGG